MAVVRAYGYKYDNLNRLKDATYQKPGNTTPVPKSYDENLTYDPNGNIKTLKRNGTIDGALPANALDDLTYTYAANSNRLLNVFDTSNNNTAGFVDGNKSGDDYTYDANGNMITDKNKAITAIVYNHLNLPTKITFAPSGTIEYFYNAIGQKINKKVKKVIGEYETEYLGGFQYYKQRDKFFIQDLALQFFPTAEGYYDFVKKGYVYNYTDHLGNVRLSYQDINKDGLVANSEILEESNYYPFGLKHSGYNSNNTQPNYKYKFGGHELQDELGLNVYDFQARVYDPAAPHFWQMDPKAEEMRRWSPYTYAFDNPMRFADPDGMKPVDWYQNKTTGNIQWFNGSGARAGFDNIGNTTNVVAGTGQALQLNSNGTATDMNSGKEYGANKTVVVNSSTGTTVKTISASEALATAGTVNDVAGGVAAPLAKFGSTSNIAAQTFSATSNGAVVSDATVDGLAKLGNVSKFGGVANGVGKAAPVIGVGISALKIQEGYTLDGGTFGPNAQQATGGAVGSIAGGYIGAEAGAAAGAAIGVWFGGVGAVPGAIIGGIIGGIGGGMAGEEIGKEIAK